MRRQPLILGINAAPRQNSLFAFGLSLAPFLLVIGLWWFISDPTNQFFPTFGQMIAAMEERIAPNKHGDRVLVIDTIISLKRIIIGTTIGSVIGLVWGLYMGSFPGLRQMFGAFTIFISLAVVSIFQPLINFTVGFDEFGKTCLIVLGVVFFIALSTFQAVKNIPQEQIVKAQTLGFTTFGLIHRIILPLILPRWIISIRFALLIAWTFLIMSEFISSQFGLGHEVFKSKRQLQMDVIIPYGLWATFLAFMMDRILRLVIVKRFAYFKLEE